MTGVVRALAVVFCVSVGSQIVQHSLATFDEPSIDDPTTDYNRVDRTAKEFRDTQRRFAAASGASYFFEWTPGNVASEGIEEWNRGAKRAYSEKIPRAARHAGAVFCAVLLLGTLQRRGMRRELAALLGALGAGFVVQQAWWREDFHLVSSYYVGLMFVAGWFAASKSQAFVQTSVGGAFVLMLSGMLRPNPQLATRYPLLLGVIAEFVLMIFVMASVLYAARVLWSELNSSEPDQRDLES